jgi:hypothetical protein
MGVALDRAHVARKQRAVLPLGDLLDDIAKPPGG